ncbi:hypothetical protein [Qipengyuania flava]|uniref:hypothetical protein n=1 Tax=Qipengyuania flava TaxID=192812 RepID=UPI00125DE76F|nr:hypothetical protein [Qipengyuania flava]
MNIEIPSDDEVLALLVEMGDRITARGLCDRLVDAGHPRGQSQIAIQRAAERGKILINDDLSLSPRELAAA